MTNVLGSTLDGSSVSPESLSALFQTEEPSREKVRILFVTQDASVRELGSAAQKRMMELGALFSEIHVLVLNVAPHKSVSTIRLRDNVWIYSTDSTEWWRMGWDGYRIANKELIFKGAFRADVVIADDPVASGILAYVIAERFDRPLQVQVHEDVCVPEFYEQDPYRFGKRLILQFVLSHADCIRTGTYTVREKLIEEYPELESHTEVLPVYYDIHSWKKAVPTFTLSERYPKFNFFILHISSMQKYSHTSEVIHGVAPILRTRPTTALIIVGNGPYRSALEKQVIALGIHDQVEFEPVPEEIISHMKSAHVLVHLSESDTEDSIVVEAAAAGLPIIASRTNIAGALLEDKASAFLTKYTDPAEVSLKLKECLQDSHRRAEYSREAQRIIFGRIKQDYHSYIRAYRDSVERCVL